MTVNDGVQIEKDLVNNTYSLAIPKLNSASHSGTLTIKATNLIASIQHELSLVVLGIIFENFNLKIKI